MEVCLKDIRRFAADQLDDAWNHAMYQSGNPLYVNHRPPVLSEIMFAVENAATRQVYAEDSEGREPDKPINADIETKTLGKETLRKIQEGMLADIDRQIAENPTADCDTTEGLARVRARVASSFKAWLGE